MEEFHNDDFYNGGITVIVVILQKSSRNAAFFISGKDNCMSKIKNELYIVKNVFFYGLGQFICTVEDAISKNIPFESCYFQENKQTPVFKIIAIFWIDKDKRNHIDINDYLSSAHSSRLTRKEYNMVLNEIFDKLSFDKTYEELYPDNNFSVRKQSARSKLV